MSVVWARAEPARPEGDRELERLYGEYFTKVHRYCRRQLGGRTEAEDATQTVFLHALRGLRRGVVPESESAWLFTIAHNVCRTYWRGTARRRQSEDQHDPHVLEQIAAQRESDHDELFGLDDALARIPETQRRAILLREWHGLSYREIAATLGTSGPAVEMLLFRARRSLAAELRGERTNVRAKALGAIGDILTGLKLLVGGGSSAALKLAAGATVVAALAATGADVGESDAQHARPGAAEASASTPAAPTALQRHAVRTGSAGVRTVRPQAGRRGSGSANPGKSAGRAGATRDERPAPFAPTGETSPAPSPTKDAPADAAPPVDAGGAATPTPPASDETPAASRPDSQLPQVPTPTLPPTPAVPAAPEVPPVLVAPELPEVPDVPAVPGAPSVTDVPVTTPSVP
jgi:RNA polymerase sigma-70 factor (ECF subfamily)